VIRLITHFFEPQFPTREPRPKLTEGGGAWRELVMQLKPGQQPPEKPEPQK
jgi:hypothetical protein